MPRENRKRGKKTKKTKEEPESQLEFTETETREEPLAGPSWIVSAADDATKHADPEAPFGYVEAEVKAYFRTVDLQIREWQNDRDDQTQVVNDVDPNEGMVVFYRDMYFSTDYDRAPSLLRCGSY